MKFNVITCGGTGTHMTNRIYVDGVVWATVKSAGRWWGIYDAEGVMYGRAKSREDATLKAKDMITGGTLPDPETAWKTAMAKTMTEAVDAVLTEGARDLYDAVMRFAAATKDIPLVAEHPAYKEMVAKLGTILDGATVELQKKRLHALESAKTARNVPLGQFGYSTPAENERALDSFVKQEQRRYEDADRRLAFGNAWIDDMKAPLRSGVYPPMKESA